MNNIDYEYRNTLLRLMLENQNCKLKFFVHDDVYDYIWNECSISNISIKNMALYNGEKWLDEEDYEEELYYDLQDKYEDDEQLKHAVDKEIEKVKFNMYICVFLS